MRSNQRSRRNDDRTGDYSSPDWDNGTLARDSSNGWTYTLPDGTTVDFNT
jgi:hypothetical protein